VGLLTLENCTTCQAIQTTATVEANVGLLTLENCKTCWAIQTTAAVETI
jgi:hypothetical protein